jgi:5-methylcytosine-specific restriction endonuclease McrA
VTNRTCKVDACDRVATRRGMCPMHYKRWAKRGTTDLPPPKTCSVSDCDRKHYAQTWCELHWKRWRQYGTVDRPKSPPKTVRLCSINGCARPHAARGWCATHYMRWRQHGDPLTLLIRERTGIRSCFRCERTPDEVPFRLDPRAPDGLGAYCKPCERDYNRDHFRRNRDARLADNRVRYHRNRERYLAAQRLYRVANIDRIRAYDRERSRGNRTNIERARLWRLANPERYSVVKHAWYVANRPRIAEASRAWRERNPVRYRQLRCEAQSRRRVRQRGFDGKIERIDRRAIWERDGGICGLCARPVRFQIMELDHIKPLARGGEHTASNVQPTHRRCNRRKAAQEVPRWAFSTASWVVLGHN